MKAPLQEWQLREYRSKLHNSVESVAHKYETLGYNQASVARITEHLDRTAEKLADDKEDQTSDARGYVEYTPRTGRMNFTTSFETRISEPRVTQWSSTKPSPTAPSPAT